MIKTKMGKGFTINDEKTVRPTLQKRPNDDIRETISAATACYQIIRAMHFGTFQLSIVVPNDRLNTEMTGNTRRVPPDAKHYLKVNDKRTTIARQGSYLLFISTGKYKLGLRKPKPDQKAGKSSAYCDRAVRGVKANVIVSQWTSRVGIRGSHRVMS
ncbi:hypothetical protein FGLOB1_2602 [Fusarium globosum]|uniref:Uncharacterized protein n=1 Tax=Fusarium globosum TaxID=78864 RepID=A0A8H6DIL6_9HYPO|nr:hypothetical protein FGLOB1_2602 [Fusarium globosum]